MDVSKMKSSLEDLCSGEERRSDKYMCVTPSETWKGKIIKGQVTFPIYNKKGSLGRGIRLCCGRRKWWRRLPGLSACEHSVTGQVSGALDRASVQGPSWSSFLITAHLDMSEPPWEPVELACQVLLCKKNLRFFLERTHPKGRRSQPNELPQPQPSHQERGLSHVCFGASYRDTFLDAE